MNEWIIKLETKRDTRFSRFKKQKKKRKKNDIASNFPMIHAKGRLIAGN